MRNYCWTAACGGLLLLTAGCALVPPRSFLDPRAVGMFPTEYREGGIRRVLTPRESPIGLANATEPVPEDLVADYSEYRIERTDQIAVSIEDLMQSGLPYQAQLEVSPTGYVRIPHLGFINVEGMTEREIEQTLASRAREAGILEEPVVQVFATLKRRKYYSVIGSVARAGPYSLSQPDTRLLDMLGVVGDIGPEAKRLYVIRREGGALTSELEPAPPPSLPRDDDELIIPPPTDDTFESTLFARLGSGYQDPAESVPADDPPADEPTQDELEQIIAPGAAPASQGSTSQPEPAERPFAPLIFDPTTGTLQEAPTELQPQGEPRGESEPFEPEPEEDFSWDEESEYDIGQRVIEIDVAALKGGDPRYNIVIRNRDMINIPVDTGVFYMMGEVARPGVYAFNGREITIKQAIATVGGFSVLAWPSRCEIIRREKGTDKQITIPINVDHIFAGLEDDVLLRDADIVNVGTDIVAPFLFVIRNSFRMTYGFGFVYDRNFADKDAYGAQINPETLRIQRRQQRGLPF